MSDSHLKKGTYYLYWSFVFEGQLDSISQTLFVAFVGVW